LKYCILPREENEQTLSAIYAMHEGFLPPPNQSRVSLRPSRTMETISESTKQICPWCQSEFNFGDRLCPRCNRDGEKAKTIPQNFSWTSLFSGGTSRVVKCSVYGIAGVNFFLGIVEGFVDNNSSAMAINFIISLVILSLIPRSTQYPITVLLLCITVNLVSQIVFPLFQIFPLQNWLWIKAFLFLVPVGAIAVSGPFKRFL
jgi:hypothetical protein